MLIVVKRRPFRLVVQVDMCRSRNRVRGLQAVVVLLFSDLESEFNLFFQ